VKVKPLTWTAWHPEEDGGFYHADDGAYRVYQDRFLGHWICKRLDKRIGDCFKTAEEALSAGQEDFAARIEAAILQSAPDDQTYLLDGLILIPAELTSEEWDEIKYTVDRKAGPDIPLWRMKNVISAAKYEASGRAKRILEERLCYEKAKG
jgi:hypothetical protein